MSVIFCDVCGEEHKGDVQTCKQCLQDVGNSICFSKIEAEHIYTPQIFPSKVEYDKYDPKKSIKLYSSYIHAHGGDGTLLRAIFKYKDLGLPFFGSAGGTENFLMNEKHCVDNNHIVKKLNTIKVKISYKNLERDMSDIFDHYVDKEVEFEAFNDIMIGGDMNSWITFDVEEKDNFIGSFKGGGLIISTPQGSTGINNNNNGSIIPLSSNLWSITGDKTNRKIEYVIKPRRTLIKVDSRTPVTVWIDGSNKIIQNIKEIIISKGTSVQVIFNDFHTFKSKRRL